jgi:hypothetical protein
VRVSAHVSFIVSRIVSLIVRIHACAYPCTYPSLYPALYPLSYPSRISMPHSGAGGKAPCSLHEEEEGKGQEEGCHERLQPRPHPDGRRK